jgi:SagB-type dehydrogenase family enzyme
MKASEFWVLLFSLSVLASPGNASGEKSLIPLPEQQIKGPVSLEQTLASRRTCRDFQTKPLLLEELAQLLWAAQGITGAKGRLRTAPSAGALYPLDVFAVVGEASVQGLDAGVYRYLPSRHGLKKVSSSDLRKEAARACLKQMWMADAPVSLVLTAEYRRIEGKYGATGRRYAVMEVGHAGQNIFLQAEALGLGAGIVGAFDDAGLAKVLRLPEGHEPLIVMPVGHTRNR